MQYSSLRSTFLCSIFSVVMQLLTADGLFIQARKALVWVVVVLELVRQGSAVELFEFLAAIKGLGVQGLVPAKCRYLLFDDPVHRTWLRIRGDVVTGNRGPKPKLIHVVFVSSGYKGHGTLASLVVSPVPISTADDALNLIGHNQTG